MPLPDTGGEFGSPGDPTAVESLPDPALVRSPRRSTVAARTQRAQKLASLRDVADRLRDADVAVADVAATLAPPDPGDGSSAGAIDVGGCVLAATATTTDVRSREDEGAS